MIAAGISDPGFPGRGDANWKKMSTAGTSTMKVVTETITTAAIRTTYLGLSAVITPATPAAIAGHEEDRAIVAGARNADEDVGDVHRATRFPEVVGRFDGQRLWVEPFCDERRDEILTDPIDLGCPHHVWFLSYELDVFESSINGDGVGFVPGRCRRGEDREDGDDQAEDDSDPQTKYPPKVPCSSLAHAALPSPPVSRYPPLLSSRAERRLNGSVHERTSAIHDTSHSVPLLHLHCSLHGIDTV